MNKLHMLASMFKAHGTPLYKVGGCVRDKLLGNINPDIDICSSAPLEKVECIIKNTPFTFGKVREKLGYADILCENFEWDYAVFRKDTYKNNGSHFPKRVEFIKKMKYDAKRRDFTINAIYENILTEEIFYFFGARRHLKKGILKTCQNAKKSFCEDALRILRLVRFCEKLNFAPAKSTLNAAIKCKHLLNNLSKKTIEHEMAKMPENIRETKLWKLLQLSF